MDSLYLRLATCLAALALTSAVHAQATMSVRLANIDGVEHKLTDRDPAIGVEQCDAGIALAFELDNVPSGKPSIDVYIGEACNSTDRKNVEANKCTYITTQPVGSVLQDLAVEVLTNALTQCTGNYVGKPTFWFLAVDAPESSEDVGTDWVKYEALTIDRVAPEAPRSVKGGSGENQIPIEWKNDDTEIDQFIVYVDSGSGGGTAGTGGSDSDAGTGSDAGTTVGATNTACGSGLLRQGGTSTNVPSSVTTKTVNEDTASGTNLSAGDIEGTSAAIAVVAVDIAGNQSTLSNVACVSVVPTEGFWDRYEANGGDVEGGCPCTALGPAHLQSAWPIVLALSFLSFSTRRRRPR